MTGVSALGGRVSPEENRNNEAQPLQERTGARFNGRHSHDIRQGDGRWGEALRDTFCSVSSAIGAMSWKQKLVLASVAGIAMTGFVGIGIGVGVGVGVGFSSSQALQKTAFQNWLGNRQLPNATDMEKVSCRAMSEFKETFESPSLNYTDTDARKGMTWLMGRSCFADNEETESRVEKLFDKASFVQGNYRINAKIEGSGIKKVTLLVASFDNKENLKELYKDPDKYIKNAQVKSKSITVEKSKGSGEKEETLPGTFASKRAVMVVTVTPSSGNPVVIYGEPSDLIPKNVGNRVTMTFDDDTLKTGRIKVNT